MIIFNGSPWTFIPILFPLSMTENSQMQLIVTFNHFNAKLSLKTQNRIYLEDFCLVLLIKREFCIRGCLYCFAYTCVNQLVTVIHSSKS